MIRGSRRLARYDGLEQVRSGNAAPTPQQQQPKTMYHPTSTGSLHLRFSAGGASILRTTLKSTHILDLPTLLYAAERPRVRLVLVLVIDDTRAELLPRTKLSPIELDSLQILHLCGVKYSKVDEKSTFQPGFILVPLQSSYYYLLDLPQQAISFPTNVNVRRHDLLLSIVNGQGVPSASLIHVSALRQGETPCFPGRSKCSNSQKRYVAQVKDTLISAGEGEREGRKMQE
nr:hypothetical protein CFP56_31632 [Quercus suber]